MTKQEQVKTMMENNDGHRSEGVLFSEHDQATKLILALTSHGNEGKLDYLSSLRKIFDRYLEAPTLLDPYLAALITPLGEYCRARIGDPGYRYALSAIYAISKVRGRKRITQFLPHEVALLEPVLEQLSSSDLELQQSLGNDEKEPPLWESIYVSWMWLQLLSLTPFDRRIVLQEDTLSTLLKLAQSHLKQAGPIRETAATCLAAWLSRQDMEEHLVDFCSWSLGILQDYLDDPIGSSLNVFLSLGVLQTLATILKVGPRTAHKQQECLWDCMLQLSEQESSNILLRKFLTKWMSRMGCSYMPPRLLPWRYQRGGRTSLLENLQASNKTLSSGNLRDLKPMGVVEKKKNTDDLFEVPDAVEDVMGHLLASLKDKSTIVRWTAAKGIGRLTERLPLLCAHDVIDALIDQLDRNKESDTVWHGSCLALGELARRGLLLPERLDEIIEPILGAAIQFDVRKGQASVGAHVRDAACYTFWAFARAYDPQVLKSHVLTMSHSLVIASLFDREVNCRRAASAAFQESVGRQGAQNFPNGIEILTTADYHSLGSRSESFTKIAVFVAHFSPYRRAIIDHLKTIKLFHWDFQVRLLASKSLGKLTHLDTEHVRCNVIPYLLTRSTSSDLSIRHGAVHGLSEAILALAANHPFGDLEPNLCDLVSKVEKLRLYRGRGGEIMRSAICRYIECISLAMMPLSVKQQVRLLDSIDENLRHPNEGIQRSAAAALTALLRSYFPVREHGPSERLQKRVVDKYLCLVEKSVHPAETRGYALALGSLPKKLLAPSTSVLRSIIECLRSSARHDAKVGKQGDAETRRNSVVSLMSVLREVGFSSSRTPSTVCLTPQLVQNAFDSFLIGLEDYNLDRRGDVGSWCRIASMTCLEELTLLALENNVWIGTDRLTCMLGGFMKQLSEKLDNVRLHAGTYLERMLGHALPGISYQPHLVSILCVGQEMNWSDARVTFKLVTKALSIPDICFSVFSGLIISTGALTASVTKEAREALVEWIVKPEDGSHATKARVESLGHAVLRIFQENTHNHRITLPLLKTLEFLFNRDMFDCLLADRGFAFVETLLTLIKRECACCSDINMLFASIGVTVGMMSRLNAPPVNQGILEYILSEFLCHAEIPRIRKYAADNLYGKLLEDPSLIPRQENKGIVHDMLLQVEWQSDTVQLLHVKSKISELVGFS